MTIQSYRTNKHSKNKSVEERLERAVDHLESFVEFFEPDEENYISGIGYNVAEAKNLDDIYKRVGNCIEVLERFRAWINLPDC